MSKNPKRLWQRLKLFFTAETSAPLPVADKTTDPGHCAEKSEHTDATGYQLLAKNPVNAAFDEHSHSQDEPILASESLDADDELELQPITPDDIEHILASMGYQFMYHPASEQDEQSIHHYTMQVSDKERHWGCMIRFFSEQQLIAVYSVYPTAIAEANRPEMLAMLAYLNYDLMIGNLEMDVMDGELRFKTSLDLEVTGVSELIMSYLLQSNFSLFSRLYDTISEMIEQPHTTHDLQGAVDKLIDSQQSRNFFLASDAIQ